MRPTPRLVFLAIFLACAALVGFAIVFLQGKLGLEPCAMCILQRYAFVAVAMVALVGAIHGPARGIAVKLYAMAIVVFSLVGGGTAIRHSWLQHNPPATASCGQELEFYLENFPLAQALPKIFAGSGSCSEVQWKFLGLSIPEWALVWFVLFTAAAIWVAFVRKDGEIGFDARRRLLLMAAALGAAGFVAIPRARAARVRFTTDPFTLGVASGAPRANSILLWTRLAPRPLEGGGMDPEACEVRWQLAADERFRRVVREGEAIAEPARAHAVHVEVEGLEPGREYHYRFFAGGIASPPGRTRTAPAPGRGDDRLRLAFASCQQYEQGYFGAHRHLARDGVDLVAFLGDYIYESSWGRDHVRKHGAGVPFSLTEYRNRHALYKGDPDLQAAHAAAPWLVIWDDHEVQNDYADDRSENLDPGFLARRVAAYRAFFEHMPLRPSALATDGGVRIYERFEWGTLATIHALDDRQYRSHQACPRAGRGGSAFVGAECAERLEPARTLLGTAQERWLDEGFANSRSRWNVIAQQTLFTAGGYDNKQGVRVHWTDGWDGYPAARERLLASLTGRRLANPVFIGGDVHATYVADVRARPGDLDSPVVAAEFCGTSITSQGWQDRAEAIRRVNPDIRYAEARRRGYTLMDIGRDRTEVRLRCVDSEKRPDMAIETTETFAVLAGSPGVQK